MADMNIKDIIERASSWKELGKYIVADMPDGIEVFHKDSLSTEGVWNTHDMNYFMTEEDIDDEIDGYMEFENRGEK